MENPSNTETKQTTGFKVTDASMQCRGFQYELGKRFVHKGDLSLCGSGFHFCINAADCFGYYDFNSSNRVFEVIAYGDLQSDNDKSVTSEIEFVREIPWDEVLRIVNIGKDNTGLKNSGYSNSGYSNSGNRNSGNWNSGYRNSGDRNSGDSNSGDRNSGNRNSGDRNSGDSNSGDRNSGNWNSGDSNSGNWNSGDSNSGNWNSGDRNSGDSNSGYRNSGAFCTDENPMMILFDKPTKMTVKEWEQTRACQLMYNIDPTVWVPWSMMTDEEKKNNPNIEASEGYTKSIPMTEAWANFWGNLPDQDKALFTSLPNFNKTKFKKITGITIKNDK